ncbi:hypothetical protein HF086_006421 [Spodoptera exigua]|uniref:Uncharacterized protein n=1 Tax=Spodoptera exigua TaxID=7107 RepID=A0A922MWQ9_SPOEX|nr:hypothetical protein HF086_006421 [Spodoptera exigua]
MQLIHLIREGVLTWISEVNYYSKNVEYEEEKYNERMKIMFQVYLDLMKAFELFKGIHQFLVMAMKRLCKNVLRLNRAAFHKMRAYHVFTIDGRLPQKFCCLLFGHIIVLLQFAFL